MISVVYRLTAPGMIETSFQELEINGKEVLLRPQYLSICKADQRYYLGKRSQEILQAKLPMALLHECSAEVIYDPTGKFSPGSMVVPCPNIPTQIDEFIAENYLPSSRFRSSGYDGFLQEYFLSTPDRLVQIPQKIDLKISSFVELVSVAMHSISRFERIAHQRRDHLGVWGDGNLGYILALLLRVIYPQTELIIFGTTDEKLAWFSFADRVIRVDKLPTIPTNPLCDHGFECVGGAGCCPAINQMIDLVSPEGTLSLLGVSENFVELNTRIILEKGLKLFGSSRSGIEDFAKTIYFLEKNPQISIALERLINNVIPMRNIQDLHQAFQLDSMEHFGKTIIEFKA